MELRILTPSEDRPRSQHRIEELHGCHVEMRGVAPWKEVQCSRIGRARICLLYTSRANGIRAILNPAPGQPLDLAELAHADYVIPNETEAETLTGMQVNNLHDARDCAVHLLRSGVRRVIITPVSYTHLDVYKRQEEK